MRPCLIAVDLQRDHLDDPRLEPAAGALLTGAAAWLERFRERGLPIFHVRTTVLAEGGPALPHWDEADRRRCVVGSDGWRFAPPAAPRDGEPIVDKTHYSGFQSGRLLELLAEAGSGEVVVIGVHLHGCVRSTALDASAAGLRVAIAADATAANDPPHAAATRRWMGERGFRFVSLDSWGKAEGAGAAAGDRRAERARAAGARAARAFAAWSALDARSRAAALSPLASLLREAAPRLAETMAGEIHKPIADGLAEVAYAAELAEQALARAEGARVPTADGLARRVPNGPELLITPWNNPVAIAVGKIAPALALGNTAVWKPSPRAPETSAATLEILARLDLPAGVLERVAGGADEVAALVGGGAIRAVSVSGSLAAGRAIHDLCAAELIPLQAELGGNNAALVCDDADVEAAAERIVAGAFGFAGQRCTATRRVIALAAVREPLLEAVKARVELLRAGDPRSCETTFAPLVSAAEAARVEALIDRAAAAGASIWRPGWARDARLAELREQLPFVAPALAIDPDPGSEVARHESFGPLLAILEAATLDDGLELLNAPPQGLVAAIHTASAGAVERFAREAGAGVLKVNRPTAGAAASLPFGGVGLSGLGPPEHGEGDLEFHTRWQAIYSPDPAREPADRRRAGLTEEAPI